MSMYRTPIVVGDRVALAPHLDLWMKGARFGTVTATNGPVPGYDTEYSIRLDTGQQVLLGSDDLLGAVAGTRVGGDSQ